MPSLDWIGKQAVLNHHREVPYHLLQCDDKLSAGDPNSGNLLVEGDNLLALKALLPYYAGQVKCIYIDPPYNTGNENWVYNDAVNSPEMRRWLGKVVGGDTEDLSRHDKWLCMMYPRLALLREFLREDGAIFVSIDDNEVQGLRYLMDEIFGERNYVTTVVWEKNYAPKASAKYLSENHDYIILYAKKKVFWQRNLIPRSEKQDKAYKNPDNDPRGLWRPNNLAARNPYSLGVYSITCPSGRLIAGPPKGSYWRVSKEKFEELDQDGRIWWGRDGNNVPAPKIFLSEVKKGVVPMTIWTYAEVGHTQDAKKELLDLLPEASEVFMTPKPTKLIAQIVRLATGPDDLILDSFAGSGTTAHALLNINKQDGGDRQFILIEMDTKVARTVTAERIHRVALGYANASGNRIEGLGGGFKYCTLGTPLFDERGAITEGVTFAALAAHVFFIQTGQPLPNAGEAGKSPLLGVHNGVAVYLLFNGILGDRKVNGGNVLTGHVLKTLPPHDGPRVIYGEGNRLGRDRLQQERTTFKQIPYQIKAG